MTGQTARIWNLTGTKLTLYRDCLIRVQYCLLCLLPFALAPLAALAQENPSVDIPRLERPPRLEDFLDMQPPADLAGMAMIEGFTQQTPYDGQPSQRRTQVYFGYDDRMIYFVFVCFEPEPEKLRARLTRRENIIGDDVVEVMLDTFNDQRRAYAFFSNPLGIQSDALFTEGTGFDMSFDTLWNSRGRLTEQGYVVWMAIPFKSLRFSRAEPQTWRFLFLREIPALTERAFWPYITNRVEGRLQQAGLLKGLQGIPQGRDLQMIPYGLFRNFRVLDPSLPGGIRSESADIDGGLDAKLVLKNKFALDLTFNPDFSQVESDEPQVTTNQRFEVFFPERRPFFLENSQYFTTPINLVFTRRIADPQLGARLTGKTGPWAIGAVLADDQSPGRRIPEGSPGHGDRALFGIFRISRDLFKQSTLGFIFTDREFRDSHNRVAGVDGRFKLTSNWVSQFQAITSDTRFEDGSEISGPAYDVSLKRAGRQLEVDLGYQDISPGFFTETGFVSRTDIRNASWRGQYFWRPESGPLIAFGPEVEGFTIWDHDNLRLDTEFNPGWTLEFTGQTRTGFFYATGRERLRPIDFERLLRPMDYSVNRRGAWLNSSYLDWLTVETLVRWNNRINLVPAPGEIPGLVHELGGNFKATLRPLENLRIDNVYLFSRLTERDTGASVFNNHIFRSSWNWQLSREASVRVIMQYDSVLANPENTSLETRKRINGDFLFTYRVNPWTVLFVGYNGNYQNLELMPGGRRAEILRTRSRFLNDGRQFFVKFSYFFRF